MGTKIKELREKLKMTQEDLARVSGVSRTTISQLENDDQKPTTTKTLANIARALGTTIDQIFLG